MQLVNRLIRKEEQALQQLMDVYGNYLMRTAFLLVKDHQLAEELVQDTFIIACDKISQLHDETKLRSWLTSIVLNQCRSKMRKWSWKHIFLRHQTDDWEQEIDKMGNPEEQLLQEFGNQQLSQAIQQLEYVYREAIILYYYNELKITEIARHVNENENTIKSRLVRGRRQLRIMLEREERIDGEQQTKYS